MNSSKLPIYFSILILFFLEVTVFSKFRVFGARPEILLIATMFFGFHFGRARGSEVGVVAGILKDIFSVTAFGVNAFSFLLIGFLCGSLKSKLFKENLITQSLLSCGSVYVLSAIYFLYLVCILQIAPGGMFWRISFYKGIYTACVAPIIFLSLAAAFTRFEKKI